MTQYHAMCPECGRHMGHLDIPGHVEECRGDRSFKNAQHEITTLRTQLAKAKTDAACDVCAGTGKPTHDGKCACGGTGLAVDAAAYFRTQLAEAQESLHQQEQASPEPFKRFAPVARSSGLPDGRIYAVMQESSDGCFVAEAAHRAALARIATLEARCGELEEDTARLDWLMKSHVIGPEVKLGFESNMRGDRRALVIVDGKTFSSPDSLRAAIDAARTPRPVGSGD